MEAKVPLCRCGCEKIDHRGQRIPQLVRGCIGWSWLFGKPSRSVSISGRRVTFVAIRIFWPQALLKLLHQAEKCCVERQKCLYAVFQKRKDEVVELTCHM